MSAKKKKFQNDLDVVEGAAASGDKAFLSRVIKHSNSTPLDCPREIATGSLIGGHPELVR